MLVKIIVTHTMIIFAIIMNMKRTVHIIQIIPTRRNILIQSVFIYDSLIVCFENATLFKRKFV